jgi:hypothetical protein
VLLDTHEYDGVSVSKCGPECGDAIDRRLDSFISLSETGFTPLFGYKNNIAVREVEPIPVGLVIAPR